MASDLQGILPVLQIPFLPGNPVNAVDETSLRREVEFCIACGADGLVIPALASEFMVLTDDERRLVVEVVIQQAKGRVPVVANVAATSTNGALAFTRHAEEQGAAAVMALPPYLRRPGLDGVFTYYAAIAAATTLPVVIQNAPPPFGVNLPTPFLHRLIAEIPRIAYIKEERLPPGHHISDVLACAPEGLRGVFGGTAGLYLPSELDRGGTGCMPSAAIPDILAAVYRAHRDGDRDVARAIHGQALPLLTLEMSGLMAISKQVLVRRGVFATTLMRDPEFPAADAGDLAELDRLWPALTSRFAV
ncbi:MAG: dihydrodipicolinate synthase family protein [Thermomicrobiales bacterium]